MIRKLKDITINAVAGANVATAALMWLVGFADYANPVAHPYIANAGLLLPFFLIVNLGFLFFWIMFKWKMVTIPVLGYAAAFVPLRIYMPINTTTDIPSGAIHMASYNVQGFLGGVDGDAPDQVLSYLKSNDFDIVCMQEDYGSPDVHGRLDSLFTHASRDTVAVANGNIVGIYTRFPIVRKEKIDYVSDNNGSMAYYLKVGRDTILVISNHFESTHLSLDERQRYKDMLKGEMGKDTARAESKRLIRRLGESSAIRAPQADSVHKYIEAHKAYPIIVCGDFNDNPISYTRRVVAKGLTDCYVTTGRGIGLSYNQKGFFVRIDNIFCSGHFVPHNCKVDNSISASDHYPITCWLEKQGKQ